MRVSSRDLPGAPIPIASSRKTRLLDTPTQDTSNTWNPHLLEWQWNRTGFLFFTNIAHQLVFYFLCSSLDAPFVRRQGGDNLIAKNAATSQYVVGWDWVQV